MNGKLLGVGGVVAIVLGIVWLRWPGTPEAVPPGAEAETSVAAPDQPPLTTLPQVPRPQLPPFPSAVTVLPIAKAAQTLHRKDTTPDEDLAVLQMLLDEYRRVLREGPTGENAEIVAALTGANPRGVALIASDHPAIQADGQLVDRWGTPYFFHALSGQEMEIISAGPDQTLGTADDIR